MAYLISYSKILVSVIASLLVLTSVSMTILMLYAEVSEKFNSSYAIGAPLLVALYGLMVFTAPGTIIWFIISILLNKYSFTEKKRCLMSVFVSTIICIVAYSILISNGLDDFIAGFVMGLFVVPVAGVSAFIYIRMFIEK